MSWESFKPVPQPRGASHSEPKVSINKGKLSFNRKARKDFLDEKLANPPKDAKEKDTYKYKFASLLFNEQENKIALLLKQKEDEATLTITRSSAGNSAFVNAVQFFKTKGKENEETKRYPVTKETITIKDDKNKDVQINVLIIDLNKPEEVKYTPRSNSKPEGQPTA
ncbi:hypothetical protein [Paenibacillus glucanolyticus]|uniref:hypothetical protein n=1 Tax=Paenibacillus glucanolyticus TaxID=59843 RepID=UPI0030D4F810